MGTAPSGSMANTVPEASATPTIAIARRDSRRRRIGFLHADSNGPPIGGPDSSARYPMGGADRLPAESARSVRLVTGNRARARLPLGHRRRPASVACTRRRTAAFDFYGSPIGGDRPAAP